MEKRQSIAGVSSVEFDRVWKFFCELGVSERHFNELQSRYRSLASTWLLATFVGIGFVATKETLGIPISRPFLIAGLSFAAVAGVVMLWIMDLMVYQKLISAGFRYGLNLEEQHPWLPPLRSNMMKFTNGRGVRPRVVGFYLAGNAVLGFIATTAFTIGTANVSKSLAFVAAIACVAGLLLLEEYVWRKTLDRMPLLARRILHHGLHRSDG